MPRHRWLTLVAIVAVAGCKAAPDVPMGLHVVLSKDAIASLETLLLPTVELERFKDGLRLCAKQGATLHGDDGGLLKASVRCDSPTTAPQQAVEGTLRDAAGVLGIHGATTDLTVSRQSGARRVFGSDGDVAGFGGAGAVLAWRWFSPAEALRSLPGVKDSQHPALMLLDGRTSGVLFPGNILAPVLFIGLRGPTGASAVRHGVRAMAERMGTEVVARNVAGFDALCTDGVGLLEGFSPCAVYLDELGGVVVGFNEEALVRALGQRVGPGPPEAVFDFGVMAESDSSIEGVRKWAFSRIRVRSTSPDAISVRVEP
jgi:hypothetical protein